MASTIRAGYDTAPDTRTIRGSLEYCRLEKQTVGQCFGLPFLAGAPAPDPGPMGLRPLCYHPARASAPPLGWPGRRARCARGDYRRYRSGRSALGRHRPRRAADRPTGRDPGHRPHRAGRRHARRARSAGSEEPRHPSGAGSVKPGKITRLSGGWLAGKWDLPADDQGCTGQTFMLWPNTRHLSAPRKFRFRVRANFDRHSHLAPVKKHQAHQHHPEPTQHQYSAPVTRFTLRA